jgi:23S rRNA (guanine745-N1)-methyltransferase
VIDDVLRHLSCPNCATAMARREHALVCEEGHAFDIARQGYVSLFGGDPHGKTADTAAMVAARVRFLGEGHYGGIAALVAGLAGDVPVPGGTCVVDLGAGTGYYLAAVLEKLDAARTAEPDPRAATSNSAAEAAESADQSARTESAAIPGLALDISKHAARHAAHAHPRIGAVVADIWQPLPIRGRAASVVLNIFSPRNTHEMRRILHPDGRAVVVVPEPDHLRELVERHGLLHVDERKAERLEAQFADRFAIEAEHPYRETLRLTDDQAAALIGMGPNAWHAASRSRAEGSGDTTPRAPSPDPAAKHQVTLSVRAYVLSRR